MTHAADPSICIIPLTPHSRCIISICPYAAWPSLFPDSKELGILGVHHFLSEYGMGNQMFTFTVTMEAAKTRTLITFQKIWNVVCPFIVCCKLISDVCWQCQKNNNPVYKSANTFPMKKSRSAAENNRTRTISPI